MKVAFDTNLLAYLAKVWRAETDPAKAVTVSSVLLRLQESVGIVIPYQVIGETYHVMLRYGYTRAEARETALEWATDFETAASSGSAFLSAIDLATENKLQFWDALILCAAAETGCKFLLSEDMQHGFAWRGLTVINPLIEPMDRRLAQLMTISQ